MKLLWKLFLGFVVVLASWLLLGNEFAKYHDRRVTRAWEETLGSIEDTGRRHPKAPISEGARSLEAMAAEVGIETAPPEEVDRAHPTAESQRAFKAVAMKGMAYVESQISRADDGIDPPPLEVAEFHRQHAGTLVDLETKVVAGGPIVWETDLGRLFEAPIPRLLGQRHVQALLLLDAMERERSGDAAGARRAFPFRSRCESRVLGGDRGALSA